MSMFSKWLEEVTGIPEVHIATAEAVAAAANAAKVAAVDALEGKEEQLIADLEASIETSFAKILTNHLQAQGVTVAPTALAETAPAGSDVPAEPGVTAEPTTTTEPNNTAEPATT